MANGRLNRPAGRNSNTSKQEVVIRTDRPIVVDATNHIAGRLASNVAKLLKNVEDLDIMKLDIKVSKTKSDKLEDIDFFADMTPQITRKVSSLDKFEAKLKSDSELPPSLIVSFIMFSFQFRIKMCNGHQIFIFQFCNCNIIQILIDRKARQKMMGFNLVYVGSARPILFSYDTKYSKIYH